MGPSSPAGLRYGLASRFTYPLIIVAVWLCFFSRALFGGQVFCFRDLFFFHEPLRRYWTSLLLAGHAPFLNTALNLGEPILANPNNAVFYPGNLAYLLLPFGAAWNITLAGHVLWAALGLYWLALRLDCARPAALCGALIFGFSGPVVSSLNYYNLLIAASWIPWAAGCALMAWRGGGIWIAATSLALAAQLLSGEPTIALLTAGLLVGGYAIGLAHDRSRLRSRLAQGAFIATVTALLASVQIVPTLLWLPHSGRAQGLPFRESAAYWSLHPARLAELLVPNIYGNSMARLGADFWGRAFSDSGLPYIMKLYAGWIPLLLLPLAMRRRIGRWAACVVGLSLLLSIGHRLPGYHVLYDFFAPLRLVRYPEKFTILTAFALAIAAAVALRREGEDSAPQGTTRTRIALLTATGCLLVLLPIIAFVMPHGALAQRAAQLRVVGQAAVLATVSGLVLFLGTIARYRRIAASLIPAIIVLDLASVTWDIARTRSREEAELAPALLASLPERSTIPIVHLGPEQADAYFRAQRDPFLSMQDAFHPFTGLRWGVRYGAVDDIDRMGWKVAAARAGFVHQALMTATEPSRDQTTRLSDALSVMRACGMTRVISLSPLTIDGWQEESARSLPNGPTLYVYATDSGPQTLARFENGNGSLNWTEDAPHHISIAVNSIGESTVVIALNALVGWSARCAGRTIALSSTPQGLMRVSVPAGSHHIELAYTPPGLLTGALLSASGLAAVAGWIIFARSRRPSTPTGASTP